MNLKTIEIRHEAHQFMMKEEIWHHTGGRFIWTCDCCPYGRVDICEWAFDAYNTQGDCLWEK